MLNSLKLINFKPCEKTARELGHYNSGQVFILRTCQRTLILGFNNTPKNLLNKIHTSEVVPIETFDGIEAYQFLLETICGLKSRILGENEIVHQFKEAYNEFIESQKPNRLVQGLLEKLFKDAKDIRSQHLKNIGLQTYAGITRRLLKDRVVPKETITILGSGQLAEDLIKITKRHFQIQICARNEQRVDELCRRFGIESIPWSELKEALKEPNIVNTIGTKSKLLSSQEESAFLSSDLLNNLICLAEPSPFPWKGHPKHEKVFLLEDIFQYAEKFKIQNEEKISTATEAIKQKSQHRKSHFTLHLPFGWEELQFA